MTLTVPLSVRLVTARQDRHVTASLRDLEFRSVVPGGFASLRMSFDRPLHIQPSEVDYYAGVYVYGPDGATVWEGRLEDPGRGVGTDGLVWEMAAVGPSAHAEDLVQPYVYIDQSLDRWTPEAGGSTAVQMGTQSVANEAEPGWLLQFPSGSAITSTTAAALEYRFLLDNNQYLARLVYAYQMGVTNSDNRLKLFICDSDCQTVLDAGFVTSKTSNVEVAGTDFTEGRRRPTFQLRHQNTNVTVPDDTFWVRLTGLAVVAMRYNKDGTLKRTGYTLDTVLASEVIADTLARLCPRFDGMNAAVAATTYPIQSLAYPDGATARQIFQDMMDLEPAFYWAAWESNHDPRVSRALIRDTFNRASNCLACSFTADSTNGWGQLDTGQPWQNNLGSASEYFVSGGQGRIAVAAVNGSRFQTADTGATDHWVHIEGSFGVASATGDVIRMSAVCRFQDVNNYYFAQLEQAAGGQVRLSLQKNVAGSATILVANQDVGTNTSTNDFWRISIGAIGTTIRCQAQKIAGTVVSASATDSSLSTGTRGGVRAFLGSGNTNTLPVTLRFDHVAMPNDSGDWGTSESGATWASSGQDPRNFFVAGGAFGYEAVHLHTVATNNLTTSQVDVGSPNGQFRATVRLDTGTLAGNGVDTRVAARVVDAGTFYAARVAWGTDDSITLELIKVVGGSVTTLAGPVNVFNGFGAFQKVTIVLDLDGANIRAKAWSQFRTEPAGWLLSAVDTEIQGGTGVRLISRVNAGATTPLPVRVMWSDFACTTKFSRHRFEWTPWPTTVRYEADVSDGFDSPGSGQGLWNRVRVRYTDANGRALTVLRTQTVNELEDAGLDREAFLDIGKGRAGSDANQAGDAFLAEHKTPPNAGTLTIARPVVDLVAGGMAQPWEIRPGNLIRVRGVLPRVDNLNATDRDGLTVFRIIGMTYRASDATAQLELDSYPLTVAQALAALKRGR